MYYAGIEKKKNPKGKAEKTKKLRNGAKRYVASHARRRFVRRPVGMGKESEREADLIERPNRE